MLKVELTVLAFVAMFAYGTAGFIVRELAAIAASFPG